MKRKIVTILATALVILCIGGIQSVFADAVNVDYKIMLNELEQSGIQLKSENDRTLIPIRDFGEMLNATVYWIEETETIQIVMQDRTVVFRIGAPNLTVLKIANGASEIVKADVPLPDDIAPQIIDNKTYIPLRAAAVPLLIKDIEDISTETLRADLKEEPSFKWNGDKNRVEISGVTEPVVKNTVSDLASLSTNVHYLVIGRLVYVGGDKVKWRLEDLNDPKVSIELKDPSANIKNFWEQQLDTQDPNGRVVMMSGFVYKDEGSAPYIAVKRTTTGLRPVKKIARLENDENCAAEVYYKDRTNADVTVTSGDEISVGVKLYAKNLGEDYELNVYSSKGEKLGSIFPEESYIMPDCEVVIKSESTAYEVKSEAASLTVEPTKAKPGEIVKVSLNANWLAIPRITDGSGNEIETAVENSRIVFEMPKSTVTVSAEKEMEINCEAVGINTAENPIGTSFYKIVKGENSELEYIITVSLPTDGYVMLSDGAGRKSPVKLNGMMKEISSKVFKNYDKIEVITAEMYNEAFDAIDKSTSTEQSADLG